MTFLKASVMVVLALVATKGYADVDYAQKLEDIEQRIAKSQEALKKARAAADERAPVHERVYQAQQESKFEQLPEPEIAPQEEVASVAPQEESVQDVPLQEKTRSILAKATPHEFSAPTSISPASVVSLPKEQQVDISAEISHIAYKEPDVDVQENGVFFGVGGAYTYRPQSLSAAVLNVFHIDGHVDVGVVDYEGSGEIDNIDDYMFEPRVWVGKDIAIGDAARLTPYAGFGYRWLYDNIGGEVSSTGATGYDRQSQYIYVPLGAELGLRSGTWGVNANAEYDLFLQGWQTSYFSEFAGFADLENTQDKGYGVRGSVRFTKYGDMSNLFFEPYFRYWHIQDSDVSIAAGSLATIIGYEPENTSTEIGAKLGVAF